MRHAQVDAVIPGIPPETVYKSVFRFDRYAELAPHVASAVVHSGLPGSTGESSWELRFRSGMLRWTERERFLRDQLVVEFEQSHGDFDEFAGHWLLVADAGGTRLHFEADFDFGIPSLEGILDPIAERVIRETVAWVVVGMFDGVRLDQLELLPVADIATSTEG